MCLKIKFVIGIGRIKGKLKKATEKKKIINRNVGRQKKP